MSQKKPSLVGITQGKNQPSTRFRWSQYVDDLRQGGFDVSELESHFGAYAPEKRIQRPTWLAASIAENAVRAMRANQYNLRFLQRNLTATLSTWEPLLKHPFVFDVDDAIFLGERGASADRIAKVASLVICGNNFLANHFSNFAEVAVLPTAVDSVRFVPGNDKVSNRQQIIGWSGSSSGFKYLYTIEYAIKELLSRYPALLFKVISDQEPVFRSISRERVVFEKWTESREVEVLQEFTIGIMPLEDDLWARGKCSFKMLTYMSTGLPVVVSPVGMNLEILDQGPCGFAAKTSDDWVDAISLLLSNTTLACQMGMSGRQIIEACYSRNVIAPKLTQLLMEQL
jgi:glycosyltransferase involved in cell wall biosynthesis